jgi:ankyrin repeat protein
MTDTNISQDTNISTEKININEIKKNIDDDESKSFFGYINNYKTDIIKKLLSDERKPEIWNYISEEENDETVIHISIKSNDIHIISVILKYCQTNLSEGDFAKLINKKNAKGVVALHYASFQGNVDIIKYLINYGADIKALTIRDLNVIHYAAQGNKPNSLVYFYLFHRDKINLESIDKGGSTPLHWASYSSAVEIAMYLINYGVDINKKDKNGNTPLHLAVIKNSYKMVQKLLQKGAISNIKNQENKTPKDIALKCKFNNIYELLKESEQCQLCNIKAPLQQKSKSKKNIIIAITFQLISAFILFCFLFPYIIIIKENEILLYSLLLWGYIFFTIIFLIFYIKLIFMDPGRPKKYITINNIKQIMKLKEVKINLFKYCPKCLVRRAKNLRHCVICDECCEGFDHHCYWVNNCIGKNNYNYFIIFLFLSFFDVLYIMIICIISFFVGNLDGKINVSTIREDCINNIFKSFEGFQNFPKCMFLSESLIIKVVLNIILFLSDLFFLVPQLLLIIIHSRNIYKRLKKKNLRSSTVVSNSNEDFLLNEILGSDQEYSITDFSS